MLTYKICSTCKLELEDNKDNFHMQAGKTRAACKKCINKRNQKWRKDNRDKWLESCSKYYNNNKQKVIDRNREGSRKRRKQDPSFRIRETLAVRMRGALNGTNKSANTQELLGCTPEQLRQHIESQWESWMTWDNYGVYKSGGTRTWHIDHIQPCASFDLTTEEGQRACFHYTNLQPLCAVANIKKGDNIEL